jgi:hypothetical protein
VAVHDVTGSPDAATTSVAVTRQAPSPRRRVVLVLCLAVVLGFYMRSAWTNGKQLDPAPNRADFQNLQVDAFLDGQLHLRIDVPPGLLELEDPFDAVANQPFRAMGIHDLTLYDGKLYAYFGPAPVLLAYMPFQALQVGDLSPTLAGLLFCSAGFLASVGCFRVLTRRFLGPLSTIQEAIAILALGFGAPVGWLVSIGRGYEVAIACGYALVFSGLYFVLSGLFGSSSWQRTRLALGSFLLAGSVAARPNLFWALGLVAVALAYLHWGRGGERINRSLVAALTLPAAAVALALAWYNVARFGSVSEFGTSYMLQGENVRKARASELGFLRTGMWEYLLSPPQVTDEFPWFRLRAASFPQPTEVSYLREPVAGLVPNMPASVLGIVAFFLQPVGRIRRSGWLGIMIGALTAIGLMIVAVSSYRFHGATMRYQIDYGPILLLASVLGWFTVVQHLQRGSTLRWCLSIVAAAVVAWSAFFAIAITAYPCAGTGSC